MTEHTQKKERFGICSLVFLVLYALFAAKYIWEIIIAFAYGVSVWNVIWIVLIVAVFVLLLLKKHLKLCAVLPLYAAVNNGKGLILAADTSPDEWLIYLLLVIIGYLLLGSAVLWIRSKSIFLVFMILYAVTIVLPCISMGVFGTIYFLFSGELLYLWMVLFLYINFEQLRPQKL